MRLKTWLLFGGLFALVAALCAVSLGFFRSHSIEAAVWPANAIVLAILLLALRTSRERAMGIGVTLLAMLGANLAFGVPAPLAVGFSVANGLEIGVAAWFLRGLRMPLSDPRDYLRFAVGAVVLGPLCSTVFAAMAMGAAGVASGADLIAFMGRWFRADALAMAVAAPFALSIPAMKSSFPMDRNWVRGALAQALVLIFPICACLPLPTPFPFSVFIFPAVAIAVFANRDIGGLIAVTSVAVVLTVGAALGAGPAARATQVGADGMLMVQALLAALVATVHPLSAVLRRLDAYAAEAEARRRQAETASASKTRFLTAMSEELRSPLTGVLTVAELVKSGRLGALTPKQAELMTQLVESGEQMEILTRKLGDAAALQSGERALPGEAFNLPGLLVGAVTAARFRSRRDCDIRLGVENDALEAWGDPQRLRQALIRLLVDASRFSAKPGLVQISAFEANDGRVRIHIEDDGDGVPLERLLELKSASSQTSGSGVGLGLTRDIMRLLGGDLGVEPGNLGGARVWIELQTPRAARRAA
ncbi:MAG: MASE1 domain-containing protein [Caulobacteraceae bacterium]|nr:MASE1 domain-containing protein [Caulobacteraceae bacterium]